MTNISKRKLDVELQSKLFQQFVQVTHGTNKKETAIFLEGLLTDVEKIMLMKRLAVILLLSDGCSAYRAAKTLKMSESTVNHLRVKHEMGQFDEIVKRSHKKKAETKKFWMTLEVLLRAGMPTRGKDRWQHVPGFGATDR